MGKKQRLLLCVGLPVALLLGLAFGVLWLSGAPDRYPPQIPFDRDAWAEDWAGRSAMLEDLRDAHLHVGMHRVEVLALLGSSRLWGGPDGDPLRYCVGFHESGRMSSFSSAISDYLVIDFDASDRVIQIAMGP